MDHTYDAIIIGAGLAGLSAALELKRHDKNFLIIEASEQVGGRTRNCQTESGDNVDLGAQWIATKELHPRIHDLIERFELTKIKTYKKGKAVYEFEGKIQKRFEWLPPVPLKSLLELFSIRKRISEITEQLNEDGVFHSLISNELDQLTIQEWIDTNMKNESAKNFYSMVSREGNCLQLDELSALDVFWCIQAAGGLPNIENAEAYWIKEGMQTLANRMAETIHEHLLLHSPVERVEQTETDVSVFTKGEVFKAKRIIVCVPLKVLQQISFYPQLPSERLTMIDKVSPSAVMKFQLLFKEPFWRKEGLNGTSYSDNGAFQLTVDSSPEGKSIGVLTLLATGNNARFLSKHSESEQKGLAIRHVEKLFGRKAREVQEVYQQDWSKEEWIQGGYGFHFKPYSISNYGHSLYQPFGKIHWAGTETATKWRMYMEGAIQSGERAANEVIKWDEGTGHLSQAHF